VDEVIKFLQKASITPENADPVLAEEGTSAIRQRVKLAGLLLRPQINIKHLVKMSSGFSTYLSENKLSEEVLEQAEILIKYEGYISKEKELATKLGGLEDLPLKPDFDYKSLKSLSTEAREKLTKIRPATIGQASRISGISPSDINVLVVYITK
jgi:tRNA uridine 5-carboxymethylaminomethyl modification enzyme